MFSNSGPLTSFKLAYLYTSSSAKSILSKYNLSVRENTLLSYAG